MNIQSADILVYRLAGGDATGQHTFDLARLLDKAGVAVRILSNYGVGPAPADIRPWAQQVDYAGYTGDADLTILQYPLWFPLAERLRRAKGARIFWYHGVTPPTLWAAEAGRDLLRNGELRTELAWYAHLVVATSPFTAAELVRHAGYPREQIRVAPLGVDIAAFAAPTAQAELERLRVRWGIQDKRVLLYVGRVAGNKRIDLLIQALVRIGPNL